MLFRPTDDFDPGKIAESGQCFRWEALPREDGRRAWRILASDRALILAAPKRKDGPYRLSCSKREWDLFWHDYFDMDISYTAVRGLIRKAEDPVLWEACTEQAGLRILRQDPWEMTVSFLISQNKNIPAISRSIRLLCESAGKPLTDPEGMPYFAFPTPEEVLALGSEGLAACSLGYRVPYVLAAAEDFSKGRVTAELLRSLAPPEADAILRSMKGVGPKVAACIRLFGLHDLSAFPVDVWMKHVIDRYYGGISPETRWGDFGGVFQQYIFAWIRSHAGEE